MNLKRYLKIRLGINVKAMMGRIEKFVTIQ